MLVSFLSSENFACFIISCYFLLGCVLAVTVSDPYAPGKVNRFVGICIHRDEYGLRHTFTLRNNIDGLGKILVSIVV